VPGKIDRLIHRNRIEIAVSIRSACKIAISAAVIWFGARKVCPELKKALNRVAERNPQDRAKDILYIHDTIEVFSGNLEELQGIFGTQIQSRLHPKKVRELTSAADVLFGAVNDMIRESVRMATGRRLNAEAMIESCRAGLKEIFEQT
jgi:hypothetical protein